MEHVEARSSRSRAGRKRVVAITSTALLVLGGAGVAAATGLLRLPGETVVQSLSDKVTVTGKGTQSIDLGTPPPGANALDLTLTCLSAGAFVVDDGSRLECEETNDENAGTATWQIGLAPGQRAISITAGAGERWRLVAAYAALTSTGWAVNGDGYTYGVQNQRGVPDLVAVIATNGEAGYAFRRDLDPPAPNTLQTAPPTSAVRAIPVFKADGKTKIGVFSSP